MTPRKIYLKPIVPLLVIFSTLLTSCGSGGSNDTSLTQLFSTDFVDMDAFKQAASKSGNAIDLNDSTLQQQLLRDKEGVLNANYAYKLSDFTPLWINKSGIRPEADLLLGQLRLLQEEGMDTLKYNIAQLATNIAALKLRKDIPVDTLVAFDNTLTRVYLTAAKDLLLGTTNMKKGDSLWFAQNDTVFKGAEILVTMLKKEHASLSFDTFRTNAKLYFQMKDALKKWNELGNDSVYMFTKRMSPLSENDAVLLIGKELPNISVSIEDTVKDRQYLLKTYQYYHQIKVTGKLDSNTMASLKRLPDEYIGSIKMNMDRIRALPRIINSENVWVTIPLMEVEYKKDDALLFHGKVVVGKVSRQTPTLWANMANVVFNPSWGVPPTILKKDVGPGVGKSGGGYLQRKGLRAFDSKGRDVTAQVNGANYKRYSYRQPPGAGNSLGEVKFNLPNKWDIYLHDTPHRENFANSYRALSSGCVRVQYPKLLAETILNNEKFTADKIDTIIATRKTKFEKLGRPLPVYIIYATIATDSTGTQLRYLNDVYHRDERMLKAYAGS